MEQTRVVPQLAPGKMVMAEQVRVVYSVTLGSGIKVEDLLVPSFWSLYAAQLQPRDKIEVHPEDDTWYAEYKVRDCARTWAKMVQTFYVEFDKPDPGQREASDVAIQEALSLYKVLHRGPHKWSVVRSADGAVMTQGVQIRDEAESWLRTHVRNELGVKAVA